MKKGTLCYIFHKALRSRFVSILFVNIILVLLFSLKIVQAQENLPEDTYLYSNTVYFAVFCLCLVILCILAIIFILRLKHTSEKKVKEASLELRHITNSIHAGFVNFNLEHNYEIIYASNGYYDIVGYSKEEMQQELENSVTTLIFPDDLDKFAALKDDFENGEYIQKEIRMKTKSGNIIWILLNGNYIEDKNGSHTVSAVLIDITESKLMQERLLLEEERYRVAAEISNDILFEYEIDEDLMTFADKYKELYGRVPVIPHFSDLKTNAEIMIHPEDMGYFPSIAGHCEAVKR
ncbi:PAS domain S-box protein [Anaerocolumna sedimenticola]|uniref:histidine kinase n=1 Tax=Anaerocolumna sedimenticola TaxID=2696063 RepID=A0A6P1TP82_9FIRM|nr:PAS domain S-box protein [Anaerocolumna sedimenticola]QHQ62019.1 PAS domain S-box protein [Anaerocolumna sedimenticola]